ncbi:VOC family protein [Actinopolymorpha alba]|uniref:VOC family protein n=1 Tax=Actinopolymorpha alba TaxID=533267 RepID=UPI000374227D|nr:VOC family protein [Actinopolymorpha alba]
MRHTSHRYLHGDLVLVIDCLDLERSAAFWTEVLGYVREGPAGGRYLSLIPADANGCEVLLQRVTDQKHTKNRLHLDLRTRDLAPEVERVVSLGATVVTADPISEDGWRWHVLADPDGNEFCILQPPVSYWQSRRPRPAALT